MGAGFNTNAPHLTWHYTIIIDPELGATSRRAPPPRKQHGLHTQAIELGLSFNASIVARGSNTVTPELNRLLAHQMRDKNLAFEAIPPGGVPIDTNLPR